MQGDANSERVANEDLSERVVFARALNKTKESHTNV